MSSANELQPGAHPASGTRTAPIQLVCANTRRCWVTASGIKFRWLPQLRCALRDVHGSVPSMHLDGMKQEEVGKSNLLGTVVAVCPALVLKVGGNYVSHYGFSL